MARERWLGLCAGLLLVALQGAAPAPAPGQALDVIDSIQAEKEHLVKGEVLYGEKWVHIKDLFAQYDTGRKDGQAVIDKGRAVIARLGDLQRQVLQARADEEVKERPLRDELTRARARLAECKRILAAPPPAEPKPDTVPPEPQPASFSDTDAYSRAHKDWESKRDAQARDARRRQEAYERDVERFRKNQADANRDLKTCGETVARCEKALQAMRDEFLARNEPILKEHAAVSEEAQTVGRQAGQLLNRMTIMGNILKKAPEGLRLQYGILEWDGLFRPVSDVEAIYASLKTEVDQGREKTMADAMAAGRSLPADWKHPKEKDLAALKTMLERAKAAQSKPPETPKK